MTSPNAGLEIPSEARLRSLHNGDVGRFGLGPLHWEPVDRGLVVQDWLHREVKLDELGVSSKGLITRRHWPWTDVAAISWDVGWRTSFGLVVCVRGDAWIKRLAVKWAVPSLVKSVLDEARVLIESHGVRVEPRETAARTWWVDDREAR